MRRGADFDGGDDSAVFGVDYGDGIAGVIDDVGAIFCGVEGDGAGDVADGNRGKRGAGRFVDD